jgi:hypothetical protein
MVCCMIVPDNIFYSTQQMSRDTKFNFSIWASPQILDQFNLAYPGSSVTQRVSPFHTAVKLYTRLSTAVSSTPLFEYKYLRSTRLIPGVVLHAC